MEQHNEKIILLYHALPGQADRLRTGLMLTGIRVREVLAQEEVLPVQTLIERETKQKTLSAPAPLQGRMENKAPESVPVFRVPEAMAVICGVPDQLLEHTLSVMRQAGLGSALKAVVTPTNQTWTGKQLYGELCLERSAVEKRKAGR